MSKKGNKKAHFSSSETTESPSNIGDLYDYPQKGKVGPKEKMSTKGKKVETPEETPPWISSRKNPTIFPPHSFPSSDAKDDNESIFEEASFGYANGREDVDATQSLDRILP